MTMISKNIFYLSEYRAKLIEEQFDYHYLVKLASAFKYAGRGGVIKF